MLLDFTRPQSINALLVMVAARLAIPMLRTAQAALLDSLLTESASETVLLTSSVTTDFVLLATLNVMDVLIVAITASTALLDTSNAVQSA